ncbi:hypothetical protein BTVI_05326 [Pitangus sulphuratus]|nr:hypothetical protein BTVI_05326 [Pitangus sulphuratus]
MLKSVGSEKPIYGNTLKGCEQGKVAFVKAEEKDALLITMQDDKALANVDKAVFLRSTSGRVIFTGKGWFIGLRNRQIVVMSMVTKQELVLGEPRRTLVALSVTLKLELVSKFLCGRAGKRFNLDRRHIWSKLRSMRYRYEDN